MGLISKFVTTTVAALVAAVALTLSTPVEAAQKQAKKKATATAKSPAHKQKRSKRMARVVPERPSFGQLAGLRATDDALDLKSSVALVMDQDTNEVLVSKNSDAVLPIASITKLMTALVVTEASLPLDETLTISQEDVDTEKGSRSRLRVGTQLTREEMLHLALMSSENRAAHALGRAYPGGLSAFVQAMNAKAALLGMTDTHYVEPTGLSSKNQSSAKDLATLVKAAHEHQLIRELSTSPEFRVAVGRREMQFRTTNSLVREQFGRPLAEFQGLQWKFADMAIKLESAQLLLYRAAANADKGLPSAYETAVAKAACNQTGFEVANEAVQVMGAAGYSRSALVEYCMRRCRGWMIAGGSIEMLKNRIAEHVFDRRFDQRPPKQKPSEAAE